MADAFDDFSNASALVVDGNINSRAVLVAQLKDLGMTQITQCVRTADARRHLEAQRFDFVLCELHFDDDAASGQDFLDDLQRNQMLPYSTVFMMITAEATYAKVAEAAESALDGYILKPHRAGNLVERLRAARARKSVLQPIFDAIDAHNLVLAIALCKQRFASRETYWLYCARVAADLMMRLERYNDALSMYRLVDAERQLNWAKLGIARALLEMGQVTNAVNALNAMIAEDPGYGDAHDLLARAQFEQGQFDEALQTYRMAYQLTPTSISRMQNLGMMTYFAGSHADAEKLLERSTRLGLESKLFDCQSLVLMALARLENEDRRGLQRCLDDFARLIQRNPENTRIQHLSEVCTLVMKLYRREHEAVIEGLRSLSSLVRSQEFDFELASDVLALLAQMQLRGTPYPEARELVEQLGMRFCSHRAITELLAHSAAPHPPFEDQIRDAQMTVLEQAEAAIALRRSGDTRGAIERLINDARQSLNVRLIDNAYQLLNLSDDSLEGKEVLRAAVIELRNQAGVGNRRATLGNQRRQTGGLVLRSGARAPVAGAAPTREENIDIAAARQNLLTGRS